MSTLSASRTAPAAGPPAPARANPFVGPVPFTAADADYFYGRDYEARELTALLGAERVVLLYSPSGAGKTSLIQAKVIPALEQGPHILERRAPSPNSQARTGLRERLFEVLPSIRVGRDRMIGGESSVADRPNRYLESSLRSLGWMGGTSLPNLRAFLDSRPVADGRRGQVLVFDQLEEVFTLNPGDLAAKREFFRQLGEVLGPGHEPADGQPARPPYWVLFAIREEYLGALDPYLSCLPCRLTTFRINLLDERKTMAAIQGPGKVSGMTVTDEAARGVFASLCRRQVVRPGRREVEQIESPFIEPVHLQIACRGIWDELPVGKVEVTPADLRLAGAAPEFDRIDDALTKYYQKAVKEAAAHGPVAEREVRLWIDRYLITWHGLRGTFPLDPAAPPGLPRATLDALVESRVVRSEDRMGIAWLELSHDRLVRPVKADNDAWYEKYLAPHQMAAINWDKAADALKPTLLLRGLALVSAEAWALRHTDEVTDLDRRFLAESRKRWVRARQRMVVVLGIVSMLLFLVGLAGYSIMAQRANKDLRAKNEEIRAENKVAQVNGLAAQAQLASGADIELGLFRAYVALTWDGEAAEQFARLGKPAPPSAAPDVVRRVLARAGGRSLIGHSGPVTKVDVTDLTGRWVVTASQDGTIRLWGVGNITGKERLGPPAVLKKHTKPITWTALSPDQTRLATVSVDQTLCVWRLDNVSPGSSPEPEWVSDGVKNTLARVAFVTMPDEAGAPETWVCAAGRGGKVYFWRLVDRDAPGARTTRTPDLVVVNAHDNQRVSAIWVPPPAPAGTKQAPLFVTCSSDSGDVRFWRTDALRQKGRAGGSAPIPAEDVSVVFPRAHPDGATDVSFFWFAPAGAGPELWLASAGNDRVIRLWRVSHVFGSKPAGQASVDQVSGTLKGFKHSIVDIAVSNSGGLLASGDSEGELHVWRLTDVMGAFSWTGPDRREVDRGQVRGLVAGPKPHESSITDIDITEDGRWVGSSSSDGTVVLRSTQGDARSFKIHLENGARSLSFGQQQGGGLLVVTGGDDETAKVWEFDALDWETKELCIDQPPGQGGEQRACHFDRHSNEQLLDLCRQVLIRRLGQPGIQAHLDALRKDGLEDEAERLGQGFK